METVNYWTKLSSLLLLLGVSCPSAFSQYSEEIKRFQCLLLASKCESGATLIMNYWLDHPEKYQPGLDIRIVHEYEMRLPDSIRQPIVDAKEFLRLLYPDSTDLNHSRWLTKPKWILSGIVNAWQEGDSLMYSSSNGMSVSSLPLDRYSGEIKSRFEAFQALGVEIVFSVSGIGSKGIMGLGLAQEQLWVAIGNPDGGFYIKSWDELMGCCKDQFWGSIR